MAAAKYLALSSVRLRTVSNVSRPDDQIGCAYPKMGATNDATALANLTHKTHRHVPREL